MHKQDKERKRRAKARVKASRKIAADVARRRRFQELLLGLGATEQIITSGVPDVLWERRNRKPSIAVRHSASVPPGVETILAGLHAALAATMHEIGPTGVQVTLSEFFTDYVPTVHACRAGFLNVNAALAIELQRLSAVVLDHSSQNIDRALRALMRALEAVLLRYCQIDGWLYWLGYCNTSESSGRSQMTITLDCRRAEVEPFARNGQPRPAWRCGLPFGIGGIRWVSWSPELRGADQDAGALDVFLQSHALHQLYDRIPMESWVVQDWAWQALNWPTLTPQGSGRWLVGFPLGKRRLGYFTATEVGGKILITTFLFLTMAGTPEGDKLRRRLGLVTKDVNHLEMDTLAYYLSDVGKDPELRAILSDCGCGHLFELLKPDARKDLLDGLARRTRKYLQLPLPSM